MRKQTLLALLSIPMISLIGCASTISGNGQKASEDYQISASISVIEIAGTGLLVVREANKPKLIIHGDSNVLPLLEVETEGSELSIRPENNYSFRNKTPLIYELYVQDLTGIELAGSVDVKAIDINSNALTIESSGSSDIELSGQSKQLKLDISGSAVVDAKYLQAEGVNIEASGAAEIMVWAQDSLAVDLSGASEVDYLGRPRLNMSLSGSSEINSITSNNSK